MSERWVKATADDDRLETWVNMAEIRAIAPAGSGSKLYAGDHRDPVIFEEPPEHFLPRDQLANIRLFDALCQIKALDKYGDHGSIDIAQKAILQWIEAHPKGVR